MTTVRDAVELAGVESCRRCGGTDLRRASARNRFAIIGCRSCGWQHFRVLADILAAVKTVAGVR